MNTDFDIDFIKSILARLRGLCDDLEKLTRQSTYNENELRLIVSDIRNQFMLFDAAIQGGKIRSILDTYGITSSRELFILAFGRRSELVESALKGKMKSVIELITTTRASISLWEIKVFRHLEKKPSNLVETGVEGSGTTESGKQLRWRILRYLIQREHGSDSKLPELSEIAGALGVPASVIDDQIDILESQGAIKANRTFSGPAPMLTGIGKTILEELEEELGKKVVKDESVREVASAITPIEDIFEWDVFVSHATEDKDSFVRELAQELGRKGVCVWYDEFTLSVGDSLRRSIDKGLAKSQYGIVVLSHNFFDKEWPQKELDGLAVRERNGQKVILPVWLDVDAEDVACFSPTLADRVAAKASEGLDKVIAKLLLVLKPEALTTINSKPRGSMAVCRLTEAQAHEMGRTLGRLVGLEYRAENASEVETILNRAVRMVVQEYSLIPEIALMLGVFTVETDTSRRGFVLKGNPDVCLFSEQLVRGERPHIPELDT